MSIVINLFHRSLICSVAKSHLSQYLPKLSEIMISFFYFSNTWLLQILIYFKYLVTFKYLITSNTYLLSNTYVKRYHLSLYQLILETSSSSLPISRHNYVDIIIIWRYTFLSNLGKKSFKSNLYVEKYEIPMRSLHFQFYHSILHHRPLVPQADHWITRVWKSPFTLPQKGYLPLMQYIFPH